MGFPFDPIPPQLFFSCEPASFRIVDKSKFSQVLSGKEDPWLTLSVNETNVMHSRPLRVTAHNGDKIEVECEGGSVKLDMESESARKVDPAGREWVYCGGLDEGNEGLGWMPVA